jgi:hypothetical protein
LRFPSENASPEVRFIDSNGRHVTGTLENESYSGIAALLIGDYPLALNTQVNVDYFGYPMPGIIRRVAPRPDGTCQVGIEWV